MTNFNTSVDECSAAANAAEAALAAATKAAAKAAAAYEDAKASLDDPGNSSRRASERGRLYAVAQTLRQAEIRADRALESAQSDLCWAKAQAEHQIPDGAVKWCRSWHRNGKFALSCLSECYSPEMGGWVGSQSTFDQHNAEYVYTCSFEHGTVVFTSRGVRRANLVASKLFGC